MDFAALSGLMHTRLAEVQPDTMLVKALAEAIGDDPRPVAAANEDFEPATPDDRVASGLIWPPVDGRVILHELAHADIALIRSDEGGWSAVANGRWRMHSSADGVFDELEQGRAILVQSARTEAATREKAPPCCIALAADGHGRYRLWRIERIA
jgi:hypothetical protein